MNKSRLYGAVCAFFFGLISIPSHAELIDNGGGLIYDTVLDITWAQPEAFETRTWDDANTWAAGLTLGGVGGWRLPYISVAAGAGPLIFSPGNPPVDCFQSTEEQCRDNELGYMFRYNLGGSAGEFILTSGDPDLELFPNLQSAIYWSGTEFDSDFAWSFAFNGDGNFSTEKDIPRLPWAVHEGNVALSKILAASLPSSRSVQVGSLASAFATVTNTSDVAVTGCGMAPQTIVPADFAYQTTDAANVPTGTPNTPADIAAGESQNFIFGFLPTAPISPTAVALTYDCTNSEPAPVTLGLNTLLLSASSTPVPDIVALSATPTADGIVDVPGTNGANAFAVATVNVGSTDTITATPSPSVTLPLALSICETNPGTGDCLSAPASDTTSAVNAGATPTYSVFVTGTGTVPFDPANNRINVEFRDGDSVVRGSTSVAVRTQ